MSEPLRRAVDRAVERAVGGVEHALTASDGERERRQAEVGLGLASAGREEQQLDLGKARVGAALVGRVAQCGDLHQHEGELEHTPAVRRRPPRRHLGGGLVGLQGVVLAAQRRDLGVDTLVSHHTVHEPEALQGVLVVDEVGDALVESSGGL